MEKSRTTQISDLFQEESDYSDYFTIDTCGGISILSMYVDERGYVELSRHNSILEAEDARDKKIQQMLNAIDSHK